MNRIHPLRTGALYGLISGVIYAVLAYVNHYVLKTPNGYLSVINNFVLPVVVVYLAGHFTGRNERIRLGTTMTSGTQSTFMGTGAGVATGVVFVIVQSLLLYAIARFTNTSGAVANTIGFLKDTALLAVWLVMGLAFGTIGGFFGDSRAHKQLKSGTLQPAVAKK